MLCWFRDAVEDVDELEEEREDGLDEGLVEHLVSVEVAHFVESEEAEVQQLTKFSICSHIEDLEHG